VNVVVQGAQGQGDLYQRNERPLSRAIAERKSEKYLKGPAAWLLRLIECN
jgi:hypothetical protein